MIWYVFPIIITEFFDTSTYIFIEKFQKYYFELINFKNLPQTIRYIRKILIQRKIFWVYQSSNRFKLVTSKLGYCKRWTKSSITLLLLILHSTALNPDSIQGFSYLPYLGIPCWPQDSCWHQELYLRIKIAFWFLYQQIEEASDCVKAYRFEGIRFIQLELPHWEVTCGPYFSKTSLSY